MCVCVCVCVFVVIRGGQLQAVGYLLRTNENSIHRHHSPPHPESSRYARRMMMRTGEKARAEGFPRRSRIHPMCSRRDRRVDFGSTPFARPADRKFKRLAFNLRPR